MFLLTFLNGSFGLHCLASIRSYDSEIVEGCQNNIVAEFDETHRCQQFQNECFASAQTNPMSWSVQSNATGLPIVFVLQAESDVIESRWMLYNQIETILEHMHDDFRE